jgi:hypothetical protein
LRAAYLVAISEGMVKDVDRRNWGRGPSEYAEELVGSCRFRLEPGPGESEPDRSNLSRLGVEGVREVGGGDGVRVPGDVE